MEEIKEVYDLTGYVLDPHTAVASKAYRKANQQGLSRQPVVIVSTASPYKFPEAVLTALEIDTNGLSDADLLSQLKEMSGVAYPEAIEGLLEAEVRHNTTIDIEEMKAIVEKIALA